MGGGKSIPKPSEVKSIKRKIPSPNEVESLKKKDNPEVSGGGLEIPGQQPKENGKIPAYSQEEERNRELRGKIDANLERIQEAETNPLSGEKSTNPPITSKAQLEGRMVLHLESLKQKTKALEDKKKEIESSNDNNVDLVKEYNNSIDQLAIDSKTIDRWYNLNKDLLEEDLKSPMLSAFKSGLDKNIAAVYRTPEFLWDLAANGYNLILDAQDAIMPESLQSGSRVMTSEQLSDATGIDNIPAENLEKAASIIDEKLEKYRAPIYESIKNGDYDNAAYNTALSMAESLPFMLSIMIPSAAGISASKMFAGTTAVMGAQRKQELVDEEGLSETQKNANALIYGAAEGYEALLGQGLSGRVIRKILKEEGKESALRYGQKVVSDFIKESPALAPFREGLQEGFTTYTQNLADIYINGEDKDVTEGIADAFIVGSAFGGGSAVVTGIAKYRSNQKDKKAEAVNLATLDNKVQESIKRNIKDRYESGLISEEEMNTELIDFEESLEADTKIPETIQGETRTKALELQKEYDQVSRKEKQVGKAFKAPYQERLKEIETELSGLVESGRKKAVSLEKFTNPTDESYGYINRGDGKGMQKLTKDEYEKLSRGEQQPSSEIESEGTKAETKKEAKEDEIEIFADDEEIADLEKRVNEGRVVGSNEDLQKKNEELKEKALSKKKNGAETSQEEQANVESVPAEKTGEILLQGEAEERRKAGRFKKDGVEYARQEEKERPKGRKTKVKFSDKKTEEVEFQLIEESDLQPAHIGGNRNPMHFVPEMQPKARTDNSSQKQSNNISDNLNFEELGDNSNAYSGAPVVNSRGEVIQGNNRSEGIKKHYRSGNKKYKEELKANADKFGLSSEQVESMDRPVLVRVSKANDQQSIELGNLDAKDIETGGTRRIDPTSTGRRVTNEDKSSLLDALTRGEEGTLNQRIRDNIQAVLKLLSPYISDSQKETIVNSKTGEVSKSGIEDIENLVLNFLFDGGDVELPNYFNELPYILRQGIFKGLVHLYKVSPEKSLIVDLQQAIAAIYAFQQSGISEFSEWANQVDMFNDQSPKDVFSELELVLAEDLMSKTSQKSISDLFRNYAEMVNGSEATLFGEATQGASKSEAVNKIYNFEINEKESSSDQNKADQERGSETESSKKDSGEKVRTDRDGTPYKVDFKEEVNPKSIDQFNNGEVVVDVYRGQEYKIIDNGKTKSLAKIQQEGKSVETTNPSGNHRYVKKSDLITLPSQKESNDNPKKEKKDKPKKSGESNKPKSATENIEQKFDDDIKVLKALKSKKGVKGRAIQKRLNESLKKGEINQEFHDKISKKVDDILLEYDSVLDAFDRLDDATSLRGQANDATLAIPMFVINRSLKVIRAAYIGGKTLNQAIQAGLTYLRSKGYSLGEKKQLRYQEIVLSYVKSSRDKIKSAKLLADVVDKHILNLAAKNAKQADKLYKTIQEEKKRIADRYKDKIASEREARNVLRTYIKDLQRELGNYEQTAKVINELTKILNDTKSVNIDKQFNKVFEVLYGSDLNRKFNDLKKSKKAVASKFKQGNIADNSGLVNLITMIDLERLSISERGELQELLSEILKSNFNFRNHKEEINRWAKVGKSHAETQYTKPSLRPQSAIDKMIETKEKKKEEQIKSAILKLKEAQKTKLGDVGLLEEDYQFINSLSQLDLESISASDIESLAIEMDSIADGRTPTATYYELKRRIASDRMDNGFKEATKGKRFKKRLADLLSKRKNFVGKEHDLYKLFEKYIKSIPLSEIDHAMDGIIGMDVYKILTQDIAIANDRFKSELAILEREFGRLLNKIPAKMREAEMIKLSLIAIEKEYQNNKLNKEASVSIKQYIEQTLAKAGLNQPDPKKVDENYAPYARKVHEIYQSMLENGEFDYEVSEGKLDKRTKAAFDYAQGFNGKLSQMVSIVGARNGTGIWLRDFYTPLSVIREKTTSLEDVGTMAKEFYEDAPVSLESGNAKTRLGKVSAIRYEFDKNFLGAAKSVMLDYHMRETLRTATRALNKIENSDADFNQKEFAKGLRAAVETVGKNLFANHFYEQNTTKKIGNYLMRRGYQNALASFIRSGFELGLNVIYAFHRPADFITGLNSIKFNEKDIDLERKFVSIVGTIHFSRLYIKSSSMMYEDGVDDLSNFRVVNKLGDIGKKYGRYMDEFNEYIVTKADQAVALPLWKGVFIRQFKKHSGQTFDTKRYVEDIEYRRRFKDAIEKARDKADSVESDAFSSRNSYAGITDSQLSKNDDIWGQFSKFMTSFRRYEFHSAVKAVRAMQGKNHLTRSEGAALLAATFVRMTLYTMYLQSVTGFGYSLLADALGIDDGEDQDEDWFRNMKNSSMSSAVTLGILRKTGNIGSIPLSMMIEYANKEYGQEFRRDSKGVVQDYNMFLDSWTFAPTGQAIFTDIRTIKTYAPLAGANANLVKHFEEARKKTVRALNEKNEKKAAKLWDELWMVDIPILSTSVVPMPIPRDVRSMLTRYKYKDASWRK